MAALRAAVAGVLANYIITNVGAEFTIDKRLATGTTVPASKTYGDADPIPLTTGSGSNFTDPVTASYSRAAGERARTSVVHSKGAESGAARMIEKNIITNGGAAFTINKRLATWATDPNRKTYGDADR